MQITIVGIGYVGVCNAVLLAQHHEVLLIDIVPEKVQLINEKKLPFHDPFMDNFIKNKNLTLNATLDKQKAYKKAE